MRRMGACKPRRARTQPIRTTRNPTAHVTLEARPPRVPRPPLIAATSRVTSRTSSAVHVPPTFSGGAKEKLERGSNQDAHHDVENANTPSLAFFGFTHRPAHTFSNPSAEHEAPGSLLSKGPPALKWSPPVPGKMSPRLTGVSTKAPRCSSRGPCNSAGLCGLAEPVVQLPGFRGDAHCPVISPLGKSRAQGRSLPMSRRRRECRRPRCRHYHSGWGR